jgi:Tfp pilus assembly protein PilN
MRIEINLLGGTKRKKGRAGAGLSLPNFKDMFAGVRDPLFIGAVVAVVAAVVFIAGFFTVTQARVSLLENEAEDMRAESRRYSNLIAQKRQAQRLRDSLLAELDAIREIDADRYVWPHVFEEVTKALPDYSWLVSLAALQPSPVLSEEGDTLLVPPMQFQLEGRTSEIAAYTRFLRRLAASPWTTNVVEGPATTVVEEDKAMRAFSITATFRTADSAFIRTVPVTESVR